MVRVLLRETASLLTFIMNVINANFIACFWIICWFLQTFNYRGNEKYVLVLVQCHDGIINNSINFWGIQDYFALDANNITLVFDSGNIVSISGNIFLYPPQGHPISYYCSVPVWKSQFPMQNFRICLITSLLQ